MTIYGAIPRSGYKQQPRRIPRSLGFARYALSFDGVNDRINCGNDASLDLGEQTITFRFTPPSGLGHSSQFPYIWKLGATGRNYYIYGGRPGEPIIYEIRALDNIYNALVGIKTDYVLGQWYDFAGTYKPSTGEWKMYINGELDNSRMLILTPGIVPNPVIIGGGRFNSLIAGAGIYNWALSAREIKWNVLNYHNPIRDGLVLWLPMEEGAGEIVYDKSGKGNHGTLLPAGTGPTWQRLRQWELRAAVE